MFTRCLLRHIGDVVVALVVAITIISPALADEMIGSFILTHHQDAITGEDRTFIVTVSDDSRGYLAWQCEFDGLVVLYIWNSDYSGDSNDQVRMRYRVDDLVSEQVSWDLNVDRHSAYMPMSLVGPFTSAAIPGDELAFEVTDPLDGETVRQRFYLNGLGVALTKLPCLGDYDSAQ